MENQLKKFEEFMKAKEGNFNGFEFVDVFHEKIKKSDAILIDESDDCADCQGVHVGSDGVTCYFYTTPDKVSKKVFFNRSVYLF